MPHGQQAVDAMTAQGVPAEAARTMLSQLVEGQSVMLATLNMFGVIAVCLGFAAMIIWLVPEAQGQSTPAARTNQRSSTVNERIG